MNEIKHVHHSYIWLGALRHVGIIFFAVFIGLSSSIGSIIAGLSEIGSGHSALTVYLIPILIGVVIFLILLVYGIVVGMLALSYKYLYYEITPDEFDLYSGILFKKRVHIPYTKIQSIDIKATLIQRIFGVCNLSIDTAGGASNKAVLVPYLQRTAAENLRGELYANKEKAEFASGAYQAASYRADAHPSEGSLYEGYPVESHQAEPLLHMDPRAAERTTTNNGNILDIGDEAWRDARGIFAGGPQAFEQISFETRLSNKELFLTGLSNNTSFVVAILIVIGVIAQVLSGVTDLFPESGDFIFDTLEAQAIGMGVEYAAIFFSLVIIVVAIGVWAIGTISACLNYGGFTARRYKDRITVERGLLQHVSQSVSIDRIQSVTITQTLIRKLIGYCEIRIGKVDAADDYESSRSKGQQDRGYVIIHPFVKRRDAQTIIDGLVPEFSDIPTDLKPLPKVALRRSIIRMSLLYGGAIWIALVGIICQSTLGFVTTFMDISLLDAEDLDILFMLNYAAIAFYSLAIVVFLIDIFKAILWYKASRLGVNRRFMTVINGGYTEVKTTLPKNKIQFGSVKTNPLQRHAKTATVLACTAAGIGGTDTTLIDVDENEAADWLEWLEPKTQMIER